MFACFEKHDFESKNIAELVLFSETRGDVLVHDKKVLKALNRWIAYTCGLIIALGCFPAAPSILAKSPPMTERKARSMTLSPSALPLTRKAEFYRDFDKALSIGHKRSAIYARRADAYFALKQEKQALADYDMTLKLDPEGSDAKDGHEHLHKCRAEIYKRMGKMDLYKKELAAAAAAKNANLDLAPFSSDPIK